MRLNVRTDERGRLVATASSHAVPRIARTAMGAGTGALGAAFVLTSMSGMGRWWLVPLGLAVAGAGSALIALANRVDRWVFDGWTRRVERHRAALVPLEPMSWPLDDVLEVHLDAAPDRPAGDLVMRLRSGEQVAMFVASAAFDPAGAAADRINEFLLAWR